VIKYGGNIPPYRETRDYVRRIAARYGQGRRADEAAKAKSGAASGAAR
jgi:hypothetical protein